MKIPQFKIVREQYVFFKVLAKSVIIMNKTELQVLGEHLTAVIIICIAYQREYKMKMLDSNIRFEEHCLFGLGREFGHFSIETETESSVCHYSSYKNIH